MRKKVKIYLTIAAAVTAAVFVCKKTKQKQQKAREEGQHIPYGPYEAFFKRPLDVIISGMALVPLLPVMGIIAVLVRFKLGSPVLFKQQRPGKDEKIFTLYKFRTMTDEKDENGELLPDEKRLTKFGKMLRSTSLDELPELFNILKGEMSIMGPRPLLVEYLPYYTEHEHCRHDVRPGLTGYAQAHGRNTVDWGDKLEMDVKYTEYISFYEDLKIIFGTIKTVLKRDGIHSDTSVTMEGFIDYAKKRGENSTYQCDSSHIHD